MSASVANDKGGNIRSLPGGTHTQSNHPTQAQTQTPIQSKPAPEGYEYLPALPQVGSELENYFRAARQLEATLIQERHQVRKCHDEMRDLQMRISRLTSELDSRDRDAASRDEKVKVQLMLYQQSEKNLNEQIKQLTKQIEIFNDDRGKWNDEKHKLEAEIRHSKVTLDHLKQQEESAKEALKRQEETMRNAMRSVQSNDLSKAEKVNQLNEHLRKLESELHRYRAAWKQVQVIERKSQHIMSDYNESKNKVDDLTNKLEDLRETVEREKKRRSDLEELVTKEKREKQVALTCLHTTEFKLAQATKELENMRALNRTIVEDGLELKF